MPISSPPSFYRVLEVHRDYGLSMCHDLLVAVFYVDTTPEALQKIVLHLNHMALTNAGQVTIINILMPTASVPGSAVRSAMVDAFKSMRRTADLRSVVVFEGSGAKAAIFRSVVTGWSLFAKDTLPIDVVGSSADALRCLGGRIKGDLTYNLGRLRDAMAELDVRRRTIVKI